MRTTPNANQSILRLYFTYAQFLHLIYNNINKTKARPYHLLNKNAQCSEGQTWFDLLHFLHPPMTFQRQWNIFIKLESTKLFMKKKETGE